MLLSPRFFRSKVNGSFYPPSSSGVGTFPTRPDKPSPRRTLRSDTPLSAVAEAERLSPSTRARAPELWQRDLEDFRETNLDLPGLWAALRARRAGRQARGADSFAVLVRHLAAGRRPPPTDEVEDLLAEAGWSVADLRAAVEAAQSAPPARQH